MEHPTYSRKEGALRREPKLKPINNRELDAKDMMPVTLVGGQGTENSRPGLPLQSLAPDQFRPVAIPNSNHGRNDRDLRCAAADH